MKIVHDTVCRIVVVEMLFLALACQCAFATEHDGREVGLHEQNKGLGISVETGAQIGTSPTDSIEIVRQVLAAKQQFRVVDRKAVEDARSLLMSRMSRLSRFLDSGEERGRQWKEYLNWEHFEAEVYRPTETELGHLYTVLHRFEADYVGLETPQFRDVAISLARYIQRLADYGNLELQREHDKRLDLLAGMVQDPGLVDDMQQREQLGEHLGWFDQHEQAKSIVDMLRQRYSRPNLQLDVSNDLVARGVSQMIEESMAIRQTMGRVSIRGSAHVSGTVSARLVPDDDQGRIKVLFKGNMDSSLTGQSGPVAVHAVGNAKIAAENVMLVSDVGLSRLPSSAEVRLDTRITGATTRFRRGLDRFVSRVATRIACRKRAEANRDASRQARDTINRRFDQEVRRILERANRQYYELLRDPLVRRDAFPRSVRIRTTPERMSVLINQAKWDQIGAPSPPPNFTAPADVVIKFHESLVNNFAASMFAGKTLTEGQARATWSKLAGVTLDRSNVKNKPDEVAITFDSKRPITLQIDKGLLSVTVRGRRFIVRNRSYPPMNVTVSYSLEEIGDGYIASRVGDPQIVPPRFTPYGPGPNRFSARESALRRILTNRLDRDLDKIVNLTRVPLPESLGEIQHMMVDRLVMRNGWLLVGLSLDPAISRMANAGRRL